MFELSNLLVVWDAVLSYVVVIILDRGLCSYSFVFFFFSVSIYLGFCAACKVLLIFH